MDESGLVKYRRIFSMSGMFSSVAACSGVETPSSWARIDGGHGSFSLGTCGSLLCAAQFWIRTAVVSRCWLKTAHSKNLCYECDVGDSVDIGEWVEVVEFEYSS